MNRNTLESKINRCIGDRNKSDISESRKMYNSMIRTNGKVSEDRIGELDVVEINAYIRYLTKQRKEAQAAEVVNVYDRLIKVCKRELQIKQTIGMIRMLMISRVNEA